MGEIIFPREEHTNWLPRAKGSALKTCICVCVYIHAYNLPISMKQQVTKKEAMNLIESKEEYIGALGGRK